MFTFSIIRCCYVLDLGYPQRPCKQEQLSYLRSLGLDGEGQQWTHHVRHGVLLVEEGGVSRQLSTTFLEHNEEDQRLLLRASKSDESVRIMY